ncbi:MAG: DUF1150 family protein [Alphaproteobacteria bacterium]|nr:DUF1150 family protein [Alphaproteobacteria bacterium]
MVNTNKNQTDVSALLKSLNSHDFLALGIRDVAYVKRIRVEDKTAYSIHAADGTPLSVTADMNAAVGMILHNELEPATLH